MNTKPEGAIFYNAAIHTMDPAHPHAAVLAVQGQNIVYAGSDLKDAQAALPPGAKRIDLEGKTVIPGLIEGHMHFLIEGQRLFELDFTGKSKEEILRMVADETRRRNPGEWIIGRGWNHENWRDNRWPDKKELDAVTPRNPAMLTRADAHSVWVNSVALRAAGIDRDTPAMRGGEIFKNLDGEPQGILVDTPIFRVRSVIPPLSDGQMRQAYLDAQKELFGYGITSLDNASQTVRNHEMLKSLYESGELKIRVYEMLAAHTGDDLDYFAAGGKAFSGLYGERLSMRAIKVVGDGSLGSESAWLLRDYANRPGHKGDGRYTDEGLYAIVRRARDNGFQACVHAIGDAMVRQAINVMERVLREQPLADHRYRIEHFQIVAPEDLERALKLGIVPAMQTIHAVSDRVMAKLRLDGATLDNAYAWRRLLDKGGIFTNGSDAPMESVDPFLGMHAAVTRTDAAGNPPGGWLPEQKLSRYEALQSYTAWAAYAEFGEARKGSLTPGKLADFAVLDRDILTCPDEEIKNTRVLLTVVGGEIVHDVR